MSSEPMQTQRTDEEREQFEARVEALEQLDQVVDIRSDGDEPPTINDIWIGGIPFGNIVQGLRERIETNEKDIESLKQDEPSGAVVADVGVPAHRMFLNLSAGGQGMGDKERRVATLFGEFVARCVPDEETQTGEPSRVDASGQKFTLSSSEACDALLAAGEFDDVSKQSQSTITSRVMREVQGFTKVEDCDCPEIDECNHGLVEFRPGRPHVLAASKKRFQAAMQNAYADLAAAADDSSEQGDEAPTDATDEVDDEIARLQQATPEVTR